MPNANEIFKDKKVVIAAGIVGLLLVGGGVVYYMSTQNAPAPAAAPPVAAAPPAAPGAPGAPAAAAVPPAPGAAKAAVVPGGYSLTNSFADAPTGYAGSTGPAAAPAPAPAPGATAGKPDPIVQGRISPGYRSDPFISFTRRIVEELPAFSYVVPIRLAARPTPPPPPEIKDPNLKFGPLPEVPRRVAGILFDGSVSAILETGTPGATGTDVRVIQPGMTVPSGIPGIDDLTVASITQTGVVLRATDGRTATVKLSNVPAAYAEAFRAAAAGGAAAAGPGPEGPGPGGPGGFGGPGGANLDK